MSKHEKAIRRSHWLPLAFFVLFLVFLTVGAVLPDGAQTVMRAVTDVALYVFAVTSFLLCALLCTADILLKKLSPGGFILLAVGVILWVLTLSLNGTFTV